MVFFLPPLLLLLLLLLLCSELYSSRYHWTTYNVMSVSLVLKHYPQWEHEYMYIARKMMD